MRSLFLVAVYIVPMLRIEAQNSGEIISELQTIHNSVVSQPCENGQIVSERAMNIFLSDKVGRYLSDYENLSYYKNNITLNLGDGIFSLNHSFFQADSMKFDKSVRTFWVVGVKANIANALVSTFTDKSFRNELGVTLKKTWIHKPKTIINNCLDKELMYKKRESILLLLEKEIQKKEDDFISSLTSIKQQGTSDATLTKIKATLLSDFQGVLAEEFSRKFATLQYQELLETARYKRITTHWTNVNVYLPVILQRFTIAESLKQATENKQTYPFELSMSHTRFWESKKSGRFYLNLRLGLFQNNSIRSLALGSVDYIQYKNAGGKDTSSLNQRNIKSLYLGNYQNFITRSAKVQLIYYPSESHIGISASIEQNWGNYKALNGVLGIPIVLIDKAGVPAANFEFQIKYFDISNTIFPQKPLHENISIGLTMGIPFSKIIY